jgi:hypothetical protein
VKLVHQLSAIDCCILNRGLPGNAVYDLRVLTQFWCSIMGSLSAGSGSRRALSNSIPARPYICHFSILSRLSCPSTGPLLHGSLTAASTALRSCFKVWTKLTSEWIPVLPSSIQRWKVLTALAQDRAETKNQLAHGSKARALPLQRVDNFAPAGGNWLSGLYLWLAPRRKEFCESRVATDVAELPNLCEQRPPMPTARLPTLM